MKLIPVSLALVLGLGVCSPGVAHATVVSRTVIGCTEITCVVTTCRLLMGHLQCTTGLEPKRPNWGPGYPAEP